MMRRILVDHAREHQAAKRPGGAMRYFGGLSEQEVADALSLSRATVTRDWHVARAWLFRRMTRGITEVHGE